MRVADISRQSCVIGSVSGIESFSEALVVESCSDSTIFVTASFASVTVRGLRRCTLVIAPCAENVTLENCADSVISAAAPTISAVGIISCVLFAAAKSPITVGGSSSDVRVGPYNAVGDGVLTATSLHEWVGPAEMSCRLDAHSEVGATRVLAPTDFFWRFLPIPQLRPERLALSPAFALLDAPSLPPAAEAIFAGMRGSNAHRAEMLAQGKFVVRARIMPLDRLIASHLHQNLKKHKRPSSYTSLPPPSPPRYPPPHRSILSSPHFRPTQLWLMQDAKAGALKNIFRPASATSEGEAKA